MRILSACIVGFGLDLLLGDPVWCYHPVRVIGHFIALLETVLRRWGGTSKRALLILGGLLWFLVAGTIFGGSLVILWWLDSLHPVAAWLLESFWCYQLLALRSLKEAALKVQRELLRGDLAAGRQAVSQIVGRDTDRLDQEGIIKATVETVAENTSDGVIAPLFYMLIGGVPLLFLYKAVNTMDSMIGYQNQTYRYFGRVAAKMDDLFNYLPARMAGILMVAAAFLLQLDGVNAWRIYRRDRKQHASPNAGQTEAACAGALGIELAGPTWYFGQLYQKPVIGDAKRPVEIADISRSCRLLYLTAILMLALGSIGYVIISGWL